MKACALWQFIALLFFACLPLRASAQCRLLLAETHGQQYSGVGAYEPQGRPVEAPLPIGLVSDIKGYKGTTTITFGAHTAMTYGQHTYRYSRDDQSFTRFLPTPFDGEYSELRLFDLDDLTFFWVPAQDGSLYAAPLNDTRQKTLIYQSDSGEGIADINYDETAKLMAILIDARSRGRSGPLAGAIVLLNVEDRSSRILGRLPEETEGTKILLDAENGYVFVAYQEVRFNPGRAQIIKKFSIANGAEEIIYSTNDFINTDLDINRTTDQLLLLAHDYHSDNWRHEVSLIGYDGAKTSIFTKELGNVWNRKVSFNGTGTNEFTAILDDTIYSITADGRVVNQTVLPQYGNYVAIDENASPKAVYYAANNPGHYYWHDRPSQVFKADLSGDRITLIKSYDDPLFSMFYDPAERRLFWVERVNSFDSQDKIVSFDPETRTSVEVLAGLHNVRAIALDTAEKKIYWLESEPMYHSGTIKRAAYAGGAEETIASNLTNVLSFAVARERIYWGSGPFNRYDGSASASGEIWSMNKDGSDISRFAEVLPPSNYSPSQLTAPGFLLYDERRNSLIVSEYNYPSLARYDLATGAKSGMYAWEQVTGGAILEDDARCDYAAASKSANHEALYLWRPAGSDVGAPALQRTGLWFIGVPLCSSGMCGASADWGLPGDTPLLDDFTNDGFYDFTVWRPSEGMWYTRDAFSWRPLMQQFGLPGDYPLTGYADADGSADRVVWRPYTGMWYIHRSLTHDAAEIQWGLPGDYPLLADYDGDRIDDLAVWRPAYGLWFIRLSSAGYSNAPGAFLMRQWGLPGDHPLKGDFDGDAIADLVVWRPETGMWYVCKSSSGFTCSDPTVRQFGLPGDNPIEEDVDSDGTSDFVVFRPGAVPMFYYVRSFDGQIRTRQWGLPGDVPIQMGTRDRVQSLYGAAAAQCTF